MMNKNAIKSSSFNYHLVTDNSADLPSMSSENTQRLKIARNVVTFGGQSFFAGQLTMKRIFERVDAEGIFPKTSAPSVDEFISIYEHLMSSTSVSTHVLSLHPPPTLSATLNGALEAINYLSPEQRDRIHVINTHQGSIGLGLLIFEVLSFLGRDQLKNIKPRSLAERIEQWGKNIMLIGTLKTVDYLLKGGRIGRAKWLVASLLNYQPLFQLSGDVVTPLGRTRNRKKALETLVNHVIEHVSPDLNPPFNTMIVGHVLAETEARFIIERIMNHLPRFNIKMAAMGTLVGAHTGPGTIAVAFHADEPSLPKGE